VGFSAKRKWLGLALLIPICSFGQQLPQQTYDRVLCVGDVVWKVPRPEIKNYGVEIFVLPELENDTSCKQYLHRTVTDSLDFWQVLVEPGKYKFVAKYFNFKKEVRTVYFVMEIKNNKRIKVMPSIEIGNK
jgi:hypothetical protein